MNLEPAELAEAGGLGIKQMKNVKVTFHRTCFWVYGRKMAKADLSYVIRPNQKVMVECRAISEKDRQLHPSLPPDIHYRATLIWVGPARPRNDKEDPNRNDTGIFQWLGQRGLNIGQFTKLIEGRLPAHSPDQLDCRGFHLPGEAGGPVLPAPSPAALELLPVLKHGSAIAHILDTAVTSTGPTDPRLFTLLECDEMAQAAHHVSEALRYAIQYYKEKRAGETDRGKRQQAVPGYSRPIKQFRQGWGGH